MAVDIYGNIITDEGKKTGGVVDINTGQLLTSPTFSPITSSNLNESPITLPTKPTDDTNWAGIVKGALSTDFSKFLQPEKPTNLVEEYKKLYSDLGIEGQETALTGKEQAYQTAKNEFAMIESEMNALKAESEAIPIRLQEEATGRGITAGGLAPIQAGELRKVALRAIPVQAKAFVAQAKMLNAQGDLETAQKALERAKDRFTTFFELQSKQEEREYDYRKETRDKVWTYLTSKEKEQLAAIQREDTRKNELMKDNLNFAQDLVKTAITNGQGDIAEQIAKLDPKSETYRTDVARLAGKIRIMGKETPSPTPTPTPSMQLMPLAQAQANVNSITDLLNDKAIRSAVGPTILGRFIGRGLDVLTGARQNFISSVEQIRSNLNLEALIGAKARGATFGALSDQELQVLASAATKIGTWAIKDKNGNVTGYRANEKDFKRELDKINNFAKLDYIIKGGDPMDVDAQLQSDGTIWVTNSDGTLTQIR